MEAGLQQAAGLRTETPGGTVIRQHGPRHEAFRSARTRPGWRMALLAVLVLPLLAGCAAAITKSGPDAPEALPAGTTEAQLGQRLGQPLRSSMLAPPRRARDIGEEDREVAVLHPQAIAVAERVFAVKGRLDKDRRAGQAGFDSFMTLGLAELVLIPKALLERVFEGDLELTAWIDDSGLVLAYKYAAPSSGSPGAPATP